MRVILAGYNIDSEVLKEAQERGVDPERLTPETLSAAYARISRNPAPVDQLRREAVAEVAKARASNEQIIFTYGHGSVAEHAVFNFDVLGLSRLAIEALEAFRLCSYTEKSQRYIRLDQDVLMPQEVREAGLEAELLALAKEQHEAYTLIYKGILAHLCELKPKQASKRGGRRLLEGMAKEDARYVTSLAMAGQLGLTVNARNLEHICRRLGGHPLAEVRELAAALLKEGERIAPSLVPFAEPSQGEVECARAMASLAAELGGEPREAEEEVKLLSCSADGDSLVAAGLLSAHSGHGLEHWQERTRRMEPEELRALFQAALGPMSMHDRLPRALELAQLRFSLVLSAACFGQLKRHRMATLIPQDYEPALGVTVPPLVEQAGLTARFSEVTRASEDLYRRVLTRAPAAAPYCLTQAQRRRVIFSCNARELYHVARLRQDSHAQWDIRVLADQMVAAARERIPLALMLACGKDRFDEVRGDALRPGLRLEA